MKYFLAVILFLVSVSGFSQIAETSKSGTYPEGLLGFRLHLGYPQGTMDNLYERMSGLNVFYYVRFNKHLYAGLNTIMAPYMSFVEDNQRRTSGYFILTLSGKYAIDIEKKHAAAYFEAGAGLYKTKNLTGKNSAGFNVFESKSNFGFYGGTGFDFLFSRTVILDLSFNYHNYYDSRNGGNTYSFISVLAGMKFVIDY